jgi:tartrate dehydratase alpha subunit/fumarate hydratase class I-like protein
MLEDVMKKLTTIALAAALAGVSPAALLAQETTTPPPEETTTAEPAEGDLVAMEEALAAIEDIQVTQDEIAGVSADAEVTIVLLSELQGGVTAVSEEDLHAAVENTAEHVAMLREAIAANSTLSAALTDAGFSADAVMAISLVEDGSVRVFVDDGGAGSQSEGEIEGETPAN